jgi:TonB family protein
METALTTIAGQALKMAITLALLYIPYVFLLRRETHFCTARTTLLVTLLLSIAVPFIDIPALHIELPYSITPQAEAIVTLDAPMAEGIITDGAITEKNTTDLGTLLYYALVIPYIIVALILAIIRIVQIAIIRANIRKGTLWIEEKEEYTIHCHADNTPPYSWMRHIVISQEDYDRYGADIILHEEGHIIHLHSWDILLLTLVETVQWFNPFVYMLANDLKDIHEYEADAYVLCRREDTRAYQMLIIKKAVDRASYTLANSFNHSNNLKKRITMMLKKKSNPWRSVAALYLLPATALTLSLFASPQEAAGTESNEPLTATSGKVSETFVKNDTTVYQVVETAPTFPGGMYKMFKYLTDNVKYPIECREKGIEGRTMVKFIVKKDGSIGNIEIVKSSGNENLDKEAIRIVSSMPNWEPGMQRGEAVNVSFTIPITFKLQNPPKQETVTNVQITTLNTNEDQIFQVVEQMPEFSGGMTALMKYLRENIKYPEECAKENIQGKAFVSFVVKKDGSISDIKIMKSSGNEKLDNESLRVVSSMPKWKPGMQRGEVVNVRFSLPIMFRLQ